MSPSSPTRSADDMHGGHRLAGSAAPEAVDLPHVTGTAQFGACSDRSIRAQIVDPRVSVRLGEDVPTSCRERRIIERRVSHLERIERRIDRGARNRRVRYDGSFQRRIGALQGPACRGVGRVRAAAAPKDYGNPDHRQKSPSTHPESCECRGTPMTANKHAQCYRTGTSSVAAPHSMDTLTSRRSDLPAIPTPTRLRAQPRA